MEPSGYWKIKLLVSIKAEGRTKGLGRGHGTFRVLENQALSFNQSRRKNQGTGDCFLFQQFKDNFSLGLEFFFDVPCSIGSNGIFSQRFPDNKVFHVITADNVVGRRNMSHEVSTALFGVIKIPSLGNLPVFLSLANNSALGKTTYEMFLQT